MSEYVNLHRVLRGQSSEEAVHTRFSTPRIHSYSGTAKDLSIRVVRFQPELIEIR